MCQQALLLHTRNKCKIHIDHWTKTKLPLGCQPEVNLETTLFGTSPLMSRFNKWWLFFPLSPSVEPTHFHASCCNRVEGTVEVDHSTNFFYSPPAPVFSSGNLNVNNRSSHSKLPSSKSVWPECYSQSNLVPFNCVSLSLRTLFHNERNPKYWIIKHKVVLQISL